MQKLLRACPRGDRADATHAISPISLKLGQVKGFTQKLRKPKPFDLRIFLSKDRPPPLVFQGKPPNTHWNIAVNLEHEWNYVLKVMYEIYSFPFICHTMSHCFVFKRFKQQTFVMGHARQHRTRVEYGTLSTRRGQTAVHVSHVVTKRDERWDRNSPTPVHNGSEHLAWKHTAHGEANRQCITIWFSRTINKLTLYAIRT